MQELGVGSVPGQGFLEEELPNKCRKDEIKLVSLRGAFGVVVLHSRNDAQRLRGSRVPLY